MEKKKKDKIKRPGLTIRIEHDLLVCFDAVCHVQGLNKSEVLRNLIARYNLDPGIVKNLLQKELSEVFKYRELNIKSTNTLLERFEAISKGDIDKKSAIVRSLIKIYLKDVGSNAQDGLKEEVKKYLKKYI